MLSNKVIVVADPAMGMELARALGPAERGTKVMPHGGDIVPRRGRGEDKGTRQIWLSGFRKTLTRSVLAVAMASLLSLYGVAAQDMPVDATGDVDPSMDELDADTRATELETITVTGTRIRGGATPSPVITIGSERIREEGFTDLGEVIRSVPQNFSGGQNPGVLMGNVAGAGVANQNLTGGSSLNLRGLGPDASLTLLNGRRMAYGGIAQSVDIAAIPVEAVERIDIVADGASAIYGSDAVGGVANVVLKRDFDGVALGMRHGFATDGGMQTAEYTATAGHAWETGGLVATYKRASSDPVFARQRRYTSHLREPQMLLPQADLRSGLVSAHQALGPSVELRLDALRTSREQVFQYFGPSAAFYNILRPRTTTTLVSPGVEVALPGGWALSVGATWGSDDVKQDHTRVSAGSGDVTPQVLDCFCNRSWSQEIGAEGPLFSMRGGEARLAVGTGHRKNEFVWPNYLTGDTIQGDDSSRFAYAELFLPLISAEGSNGKARRLELTAALRGEDYANAGRVNTPKLGVVYGPSEDYTIRASWGESFKVPTLLQLFRPHAVQVSLASGAGGLGYPQDALVLSSFGGTRALEPERARVWTASMALHPKAMPGLEMELAWFDINYTDRVVEPIGSFSQALSNPAFAEFVRLGPSLEEQSSIIASADQFFNFSGLPYDPGSVVAFIDARYINAARQRIRGIDLSGSYRFVLGSGQLTLRGSANWLDSTQQATTTTFNLAGTLHNPPKTSARLGTVWSQGGLTASAFANYKQGVSNVVAGEKLASFTTFDATLRYAPQRSSGAWSGWEFAFTAQNLLDRAPPLYTVAANRLHVPPYDSTNASPIGRFLSTSVSKRW